MAEYRCQDKTQLSDQVIKIKANTDLLTKFQK